jgi:hypothetical protein
MFHGQSISFQQHDSVVKKIKWVWYRTIQKFRSTCKNKFWKRDVISNTLYTHVPGGAHELRTSYKSHPWGAHRYFRITLYKMLPKPLRFSFPVSILLSLSHKEHDARKNVGQVKMFRMLKATKSPIFYSETSRSSTFIVYLTVGVKRTFLAITCSCNCLSLSFSNCYGRDGGFWVMTSAEKTSDLTSWHAASSLKPLYPAEYDALLQRYRRPT